MTANVKLALRRALDGFKNGSPVEQSAVRAFEEHFDDLGDSLAMGSAHIGAIMVMEGLERTVKAINAAIVREIGIQMETDSNEEIKEAEEKAKSSMGAIGTFLRKDQCSHGNADETGIKVYNLLLEEMHKVGEILRKKPKGCFANLDGSMVWISPLKNTPGADVFIYSCGGFDPELDGTGTYPLAYFDELGVASEVLEVTEGLREWLKNPVFGQMAPDYRLDQVAWFSNICRYRDAES